MPRELRHEFSWSVSRAGAFAECRRRYYYDYYGSWAGWGAEAPSHRREIWLLKKLTRFPMLAGDCLHRALAHWFAARNTGQALAPAEIEAWAVEELRAGYRQSKSGEWRRRPAKLVHLAEHQYGDPELDEPSGRAAETGKRYVERIAASVRSFFGMSELEGVRASEPGAWLACEEFGTIDLCGARVHAVPDFALREADGAVAIYDWKTGGEREEHAFQLGLYAIYAERKWGADPTRARCVAVYLEEGRAVEHRFGAAELDGLMQRVGASIDAMRSLHFDADAGDGAIEEFPMVEPGSRACRQCNYRGPCGRA